ncbi:protein LONGIFOLIA 1-like [Gossypium australe]|uniref:Protein LONGIFOLIA 1-like n=1 Tax=Gossypium australe TaxID=47621 RepID=A0A5B6V5M3_9ROSI|nr:protein LONGIFOLIA 1-like [Gossypium australe]
MSSKFMYSLSDENPDLQKQIGCMNGLFQLFDCHHFYGNRRIAGPNRKRLPSGQNGKHGTEAKIGSDKIKGNILKKTVKEKQRYSFESPRTSLSSSSCSSSFSPADCSKESLVDRSSSSQTAFHETPRKEISSHRSNASLQSSQNSLNLRDVVKDSIYREACGLSIKTATKVEAGQHQTLKYIDSPRPLQSPKPSKTRNTSLNESSHALLKLKGTPKMYNECEDGSLTFAGQDAPRLSYDGRGAKDAHKIKPKDLPRLSLDSRESSIKGSVDSMKSDFLLGEINRSRMKSNDIRNQEQEPGSYKGPSSVVAKLMGVEALLNPMLTNGNRSRDIKTCQDFKSNPASPSSRINEKKKSLISGCSRNSGKEPRSPRNRMTNVESKKPVATRCPIESAPWRQLDGNKGALKSQETPMKAPNSFLTVYGEIEKSLAALEFMKSGKDIGALKQTLEEMQMSDTRKEEQASSLISHTSSIPGQSSEAPNLRKLHSKNAVSATIKETSSPTCLKLPIKIINEEKVMENGSNSTSTVVATSSLRRLRTSSHANTRSEKADKQSYKDSIPKPKTPKDPSSRLHSRDKNTARTLRDNQISKEPSPTEENTNIAISSETTCLKLHQKKLEMEKQPRRTDPASDQRQSRRQSSSLQAESGLPHQKPRHKSHNLRQSDDQLSDISSDMRDLNHQGDHSSMQSESNMSMASYGDTEVTSAQSYGKIEGTFSQEQEKKQKNPAARLIEGDPKAEPPRTAPEQPSPVSVLDAAFYGDESPSPVKKTLKAFEGKIHQAYAPLVADCDEGLTPNDADWSSIGLNHLPTCRETSPRFKTDSRKAENIQRLVQKFMNLDSIDEWAITNEIIPNPDHEYIAEVMLASGLLSELDSSFMACQLHPSGHLINPNLFPALEQTRASIWLLNRKHNGRKVSQLDPIEKNHRLLIFDAINEILIIKSVKKGSYKQWILPSTVKDTRQKRQQVVRDLCSDIDKMQTTSNIEDKNLNSIVCGDLMLGSMDWTEFKSEIPWIALDVERLIFKDLICEVISCEVTNLQQQHRGHCRRLFLK